MWGWGRARAQQGGGRWTMLFLCVSSTWAAGRILNQRRCQPTSEWCVVFCALSPGNLWKVYIEIFLGWDNSTPLGKRASFWGTWVNSFFCFGTLVWWVLFYVPEILGQHCYCGKLWLQQHGGSEQGRNQIWILIADCICEGEAGKRNISLTAPLVWKLNAFWELKLEWSFYLQLGNVVSKTCPWRVEILPEYLCLI